MPAILDSANPRCTPFRSTSIMSTTFKLTTPPSSPGAAWACAALLALATGPALASTASIAVSPASKTVAVGNTFDLTVDVLSHSDTIGAYDFSVLFGTAGVLSLTGVSFSDALGGVGEVDNLVTLPSFAATSFLLDLSALQSSPSFTLATLHFSALAAGVTTVALDPNLLGDSLGDLMTGTYSNALVTVTGGGGVPAIPEPSTYALMLLGLGGVAVWGRRQRR